MIVEVGAKALPPIKLKMIFNIKGHPGNYTGNILSVLLLVGNLIHTISSL